MIKIDPECFFNEIDGLFFLYFLCYRATKLLSALFRFRFLQLYHVKP